MSTCSPSKEKCCSLISEIIDKSKDIIVENEDVLDFDAVELTVLLKSMGFRLNSLDFDCSRIEDAQDVEIEIKCHRSGIHSKLSMKSKTCTCPSRKSINNNSFWEVQGIAPSTPTFARNQGIVQDTSCNLLPDVSKKTTSLARTMLTVLLQHYQIDFEQKTEKEQLNTVIDVKQLVERLHGGVGQENTVGIEEFAELAVKRLVSPVDKVVNTNCSTPLSSINITPVPSYAKSEVTAIPKLVLNTTNENTQENLIDLEKPPEECYFGAQSSKKEVLSTASIEGESTFDKINPDTERDIHIIKAITEARKQLDTALLTLKCNITRTLSQSSLVTVTPKSATSVRKSPLPKKENIPIFPVNQKLAAPVIPANRRHSTGARLENKSSIIQTRGLLSTAKSSGSVNDIRKKVFSQQLSSTLLKPDTPRPRITPPVAKKPPIGVNSKMFTKRTPVGTNPKSNSLIPKVTVSKYTKLPTFNLPKKN